MAIITEYLPTNGKISVTKPVAFDNQNAAGSEDGKEHDAKLRGRAKWDTLQALVINCSIVASSLSKREKAIGRAKWVFKPNKDHPAESQRIAEQIEAIFDDMDKPWDDVVLRMAGYELYGFELLEFVLKRSSKDYRYGIKELFHLPHQSIVEWAVNERGEVIGVWQETPKTRSRIPVPIEKLIYLKRDSYSDNPSGLGLLRQCVKDADTLAKLQQTEALGFDNDLRGIPIIKAPLLYLQRLVEQGELSQQKADEMLAPLKDFAKNHAVSAENGLFLGSEVYEDNEQKPGSQKMWEVELLTGDGGNLSAIGEAISRYVYAIARILGCDFLLIGEGNAGSFALHDNKSAEFHQGIDGTLRQVASVVKRQIFPILAEFNGWPTEWLPDIEIEGSRSLPLDIVGELFKVFAAMGLDIYTAKEAIAEVFARVGLTPPDLEAVAASAYDLEDSGLDERPDDDISDLEDDDNA